MNVRTHIRLDRVSSTNDFAQFLVSRTKPAEGTVISAVDQYAGRGQAGRSWYASPGRNITASFIFYPGFVPVKDQFRLNKLFSVSVLHFFRKFVDKGKMMIKWPNDLLLEERKVAGLLIRVSTTSTHIRHAVMGLGFNVFEDRFPKEIPNPDALYRYSSDLPAVPELINAFREYLVTGYERLRAGSNEALDVEYTRNLYGIGQSLAFSSPDTGSFEGVIQGVDEFGRLVIQTGDRFQVFQSGGLVFQSFNKGN